MGRRFALCMSCLQRLVKRNWLHPAAVVAAGRGIFKVQNEHKDREDSCFVNSRINRDALLFPSYHQATSNGKPTPLYIVDDLSLIATFTIEERISTSTNLMRQRWFFSKRNMREAINAYYWVCWRQQLCIKYSIWPCVESVYRDA